jgi:hypothetical protein
MNPQNGMDELILNGTLLALLADFPALAKRFQEILCKAPVLNPIFARPGQSVLKRYAVDLTPEEMQSVLNALESLGTKHGLTKKFEGVNLSRLCEVWTRKIENRRAHDASD